MITNWNCARGHASVIRDPREWSTLVLEIPGAPPRGAGNGKGEMEPCVLVRKTNGIVDGILTFQVYDP